MDDAKPPAKGQSQFEKAQAKNASLESEMMKVSDTANDYALMTNLYRRQLGLVKSVLGRGQG